MATLFRLAPTAIPWPTVSLARSHWLAHVCLACIVLLWALPTIGLAVSSFRTNQQVTTTGWWTAWNTRTQTDWVRTAGAASQHALGTGGFRTEGRLWPESSPVDIRAYSLNVDNPQATPAGQAMQVPDGLATPAADGLPDGEITVYADGRYVLDLTEQLPPGPGLRVFVHAAFGPTFTLQNYRYAVGSEGVGDAFWNTLRVAVPATVLPVLLALGAAYALACMPGRHATLGLGMMVVAMIVPMEMVLIPLLRLYNQASAHWGGEARTWLGGWLVHSALALPIGTFLLTNYLRRLPRELMDAARLDCDSHLQVLRHVVLPLAFPGLVAFGVLQFLWVWNDYLIGLMFIGTQPDQVVLAVKLRNLLGCTGYNWEFLPAAAFVSMAVPMAVFLVLQKWVAQGLVLSTTPSGH